MLYEQAGGDGETIHQYMMEKNLVGCDILPNAAHLTASIIASTYPDVRIGGTRIHTMPYGTPRADGLYAIGALNLLSDPSGTLPLALDTTETATGQGTETTDLRDAFRHGEFDIVIQNPPYTRGGADSNSNMPKTIFADKKVASTMRDTLKAQKCQLIGNNTGLGAHFVDLADRMLKRNGKMAFVLPLTTIVGNSWHKVRQLWAEEYHDVFVLTIADAVTKNCAFSSDTSIAECFVIATKGKSKNTGRATFVCLKRCPNGELEALEIAKQIYNLEDIRRLEEGTNIGNPIQIGDDIIGFVISAPIPQSESGWPISRLRDIAVVQSAYQLSNGRLKFPRQKEPITLHICSLSDIAEIGADHRDIYDPGKRGAFDVEEGCSETAEYPGLWKVDCKTQRSMVVMPNASASIRPGAESKAHKILELNGRVHFNRDLGFNSHSLAVAFTEQDALGVDSMPNVVFKGSKIYDYVWTLWGNSTLGFLCYWVISSKQQTGRGRGSKASLESMPTLDVRHLSAEALANAERIFNELKHKEMLPFNQIDEDTKRHELDRLLLSEVLGITEAERPDVHEGLALLRKMLSQEPSIHGGKKSKVKLDAG